MSTNDIGGLRPLAPGLTGNPEADAMRYAQAKGISLDEAKAELKSKFGDPKPPVQNSVFANQSQLMQMQLQNMPQVSSLFNFLVPQTTQQPPAPQTPEQMLCAKYGIPPEITAQGDDAIRKYAQDNNISLPAKENSTTSASTRTTDTTSTTTATTNNTEESDSSSTENKMSRKEAKAWVKAYRKEHNCSKKEAKAAFEKEFGYEYPKANTKWIGFTGLGVFAAAIASLAIFGGGSSSGHAQAPQPWEFGGKNHFS